MPPKKAPAKGKAPGKGGKEAGGEPPKDIENLLNEIADKELRIQDLLLDLARYVMQSCTCLLVNVGAGHQRLRTSQRVDF